MSDWAKLLKVGEISHRPRLIRDHGLRPPEPQVLDLASGGGGRFRENSSALGWLVPNKKGGVLMTQKKHSQLSGQVFLAGFAGILGSLFRASECLLGSIFRVDFQVQAC